MGLEAPFACPASDGLIYIDSKAAQFTLLALLVEGNYNL